MRGLRGFLRRPLSGLPKLHHHRLKRAGEDEVSKDPCPSCGITWPRTVLHQVGGAVCTIHRLRLRVERLGAIVRAADEMRRQVGTDMVYLPEAEAYDAARGKVEL